MGVCPHRLQQFFFRHDLAWAFCKIVKHCQWPWLQCDQLVAAPQPGFIGIQTKGRKKELGWSLHVLCLQAHPQITILNQNPNRLGVAPNHDYLYFS